MIVWNNMTVDKTANRDVPCTLKTVSRNSFCKGEGYTSSRNSSAWSSSKLGGAGGSVLVLTKASKDGEPSGELPGNADFDSGLDGMPVLDL